LFLDYLLWFDKLPEVISTYGGEIDDLIYYIYYITGAVFVFLELYLLYIVIVYRKRAGHKASGSKNLKVEIMTLLIADILLLALDVTIGYRGIVGYSAIKEDLPKNPAVVMRAIGAQYSWTFVYPGTDGKLDTVDDVTSINELILPINKPVQINLRGRDVLHSLFLPAARYKQDVLPGREIQTWVELNKTGKTPVICAELCGAGHTNMGGTLTAVTLDKFNEWHEAESAKAEEDAL
jgi:cytochrome c oxidase subunit 2